MKGKKRNKPKKKNNLKGKCQNYRQQRDEGNIS